QRLAADPDAAPERLQGSHSVDARHATGVHDPALTSNLLECSSESRHKPVLDVGRLTHEFSLKEHLDHSWALQPLELVRDRARPFRAWSVRSWTRVASNSVTGVRRFVKRWARMGNS